MASLNISHRPNDFDEIIGNKKSVSLLKSILSREKERIPHAFLMYGDTGCGKTTLARIIASKLGCSGSSNNTDFVELDIAHFTGVDTARDIRAMMKYAPMHSKCRVWVLDEFHKASTSCQSAMLKALEDAPDHCYFVLCTTDPQKLLKTIKDRCSSFKVSLLTDNEIVELVSIVSSKENIDIPEKVKHKIAEEGRGCPRQALMMLDQILDVPVKDMLSFVKKDDVVRSKEIRDLCQSLLKDHSWKDISVVLKALKGVDPESIRRAVIGYMSAVLINSGSRQAALILDIFRGSVVDSGMPGIVLYSYQAVNE